MSEDRRAINRHIDEWMEGKVRVCGMVPPYTESWALVEAIESRCKAIGWNMGYTCRRLFGPSGGAQYVAILSCNYNGKEQNVEASGETLQLAMSRAIDLACRVIENATRTDPKAPETPPVEKLKEPWLVLMDFIRSFEIGDEELVLLIRGQRFEDRSITPAMATRLGLIFPSRPASYWLRMEADYRAALAKNAARDEYSQYLKQQGL